LACLVVLVGHVVALFSKDGKASLRGDKEPDLSSAFSKKSIIAKGVSEVKTESIFVNDKVIADAPTQNWKGLGYYSVNFYNGADNACTGTPLITEGYQTNKCLQTGTSITAYGSASLSGSVMFQCIGAQMPQSMMPPMWVQTMSAGNQPAMPIAGAASGVMVTTYTDTACTTNAQTIVYPTGACVDAMGSYGKNNNYMYSYMNTEDTQSLKTQQQMLNNGGIPMMQAMCTLVNKASPGIPL